ncbi:zonular occludens toxin domain-containing protein [Paenibacillus sp. MMO-177]|uniref:zonular occludens toxin domain-containing protein n=1 Tax=Paenibacillus sp. MMO-177 TaxID=3081289 RepID=UPI003017FEB5
MYLVGISGAYGNGKSITAVIKAHQWAAASGAKLFTNFPCRNAYLFDHYEDWYKVADAHGSIILFDEAQRNWDNRTWGGAGQVIMTQVLNYVRKMNCLIIFILPSFQNVDKRIREMTDLFIECKKLPSGTIINDVYDHTAQDFGPKGKHLQKWTLPVSSQKHIHQLKLYNTHSMIHKFPTPPPNKEEQFFEELDRRHNAALQRVYGTDYMEIETLSKEGITFAS